MTKFKGMLSKSLFLLSVICFSLFGLSLSAFADTGDTKKVTSKSQYHHQDGSQLPDGHRIIYGTVEGVFKNTIKVNSGEIGEMTPRYLELEKLGEKADEIQPGDRLKITVNSADNKVVDYQLAKQQ